jgi:hypothetical protein
MPATPLGRRDDRQPDQSGPAPTYLRGDEFVEMLAVGIMLADFAFVHGLGDLVAMRLTRARGSS